MIRRFKIDETVSRLVDKSTLFRVISYLDKGDIETPCLLINGDKLRANLSAAGKGISGCRVFYALKANPDIEVARIAEESGIGFEIASGGELDVLASLNVSPDRIITSNPVKTPAFIQQAYGYGVRYFAYDADSEIEKLAIYAPEARIYVRLSVPNEGSEWPLSRKFGVELDAGLLLMQKAIDKGLNPVGITFHVGSQCTNIYNWNNAIDKALRLWEMADAAGIRLNHLNMGGGFPVNYTRNVITAKGIEAHVERLLRERFPEDIEIHIEPGRSIVGDTGIFATRVIGKADRTDGGWCHLDVGVFNGLMESLGGIRYSYIQEIHEKTGKKRGWTLTGPSCDSFDVIDKNVILSEPRVGDIILILSGGAYTISYASEFNGFNIPRTIVI